MIQSRCALLLLLVLAPLIVEPPSAAADHQGLTVVPVDRGRPPLRVKAWVDRGPDALYFPGERVCVRFTVNDDAYVCVYNIDTEGNVRVLFPAYGDDGFVGAHEVVTLPGPYADFDYVVTGPPGIETIEVVASRPPLADWDDAWEGEDENWYDDDDDQGDYDEQWNNDDDQNDEEWDENDQDEDRGAWETNRLDDRPIPRPRPTGLTVSGDPFVGIRRVNHRLLPSHCEERDYDTSYVSFCVGRRVAYPRYTCNDCHGPYHGYDPYADHCSVFSVRVNVHWGYPRHNVYVVHRRALAPRYIYVRHRYVPSPYKDLKRVWSSQDRPRLRKEFYSTPAWKPAPEMGKPRKWERSPAEPKGSSRFDRSKGGFLAPERGRPEERNEKPGRDPRSFRSPKPESPREWRGEQRAERSREWKGERGKERRRWMGPRDAEAAEPPRERRPEERRGDRSGERSNGGGEYRSKRGSEGSPARSSGENSKKSRGDSGKNRGDSSKKSRGDSGKWKDGGGGRGGGR